MTSGRLILLLPAAAAVSVLSCGGGPGSETVDMGRADAAPESGVDAPPGSGPTITVHFEPPDLTTAAEREPLRIRISSAGQGLSHEVLHLLLSNVELASWPELTPLVFGTTTPVGMPELAYVDPPVLLTDRWYVLRAKKLPDGFSSSQELPDGSWGSRFRLGSLPGPVEISFCREGHGPTEVKMVFSEVVTAAVRTEDIVSVANPPGEPSPTCRDLGASARTLPFLCEDLSHVAVTITLGAGIHGTTGVPANPLTLKIGLADLPRVSSRCVRYQVNPD